jgi:hypothetical protein
VNDKIASLIEMQLKRIADALDALARKHGEPAPPKVGRAPDSPPPPTQEK